MRSLQLSLGKYNSDKIDGRHLEHYDHILEPWLNKKIVLLELGIHKGGSLLLWRDYFPLGTVIGVDINPPEGFMPGERIHIYKGSQADPGFLSHVANETAPKGFDIIIDDASHLASLTKIAFWHLFDNHLKPGGLYVIEDWGTGYWSDWPDGRNLNLDRYLQPKFTKSPLWLAWMKVIGKLRLTKSMRGHGYGMVGFVKQLIDEQAARDVTRAKLNGSPKRESKFENMLVTPSIVFIKKAYNDNNRSTQSV